MKIKVSELKEPVIHISGMPNKLSAEYQALRESIRERGVMVPLLVNRGGVVIDGLCRYCACVDLGIEEVECIVRDLTPEQVLELRLMQPRKSVKLSKQYLEQLLMTASPITLDEMSARIGRPGDWIVWTLGIELLAAADAAMRTGRLSLIGAVLLSRIPAEQQGEYFDRAISDALVKP